MVAAGVEAGDGDQVDEGIAAGLEEGVGCLSCDRRRARCADLSLLVCGWARQARPAGGGLVAAGASAGIDRRDGRGLFRGEADRLVAEQKMRLDAHDPAAEASLLRSLAIARGQRAQLLARRAGAALAHKWRGQGRRAQARALLATLHVPPVDAPAQRPSGHVPSR